MKQIIYTVLFLVAIGLTGCQKAEYLLFNDIARVQMDEANEILTSFYYMDAAIGRDTVYLTVNTIGKIGYAKLLWNRSANMMLSISMTRKAILSTRF